MINEIKMKRPRYIIIGGDIEDARIGPSISNPEINPGEETVRTSIILGGRIKFEITNTYETFIYPSDGLIKEIDKEFTKLLHETNKELAAYGEIELDNRLEFIHLIGEKYTETEQEALIGEPIFIGSTAFMILGTNHDSDQLVILAARMLFLKPGEYVFTNSE